MIGKPVVGWPRIIVLGIAGCVVGSIVSSALSRGSALTLRTETEIYPAAYQLPKIPGGTSLRMAMIHDVLLERYLKHGSAWYEKRVADARKTLEAERGKGGSPSIVMLEAMDDVAVGLENLHKSEEAAEVMREKLKLMPAMEVKVAPSGLPRDDWGEREVAEITQAIRKAEALTPEMRMQYTARANLGTSLIHGNFAGMLAGDEAALARMEEGVDFIRQSMAINPGAHFGRETWQAAVVLHFLACRRNPGLMTTYDMIGDDLGEVKVGKMRDFEGRLSAPAAVMDAQASIEKRIRLREEIMRVGVAEPWAEVVHCDIAGPAHFDEPALALMGMWMLGGGPSAHSALALGNIALQVGQLEIAWDGLERAVELQEGFSQDAEVREMLVAYCRRQQAVIAGLKVAAGEAADGATWQSATRKRHVDELAWAMRYRAEYQAWEAKQLAAGVGLEGAEFYDGFFKTHSGLASPVGHVDENATRFFAPDGVIDGVPAGLALGGVLMLLGAVTAKRVV